MVEALFGSFDLDDFWSLVFELLYTQHGGSGLGLTMTDIWELPIERLQFFYDELSSHRRSEANALRSAAKKR